MGALEQGGCLPCSSLDPKEINPGIHYCHRFMLWVRIDRGVTCTQNDGRDTDDQTTA